MYTYLLMTLALLVTVNASSHGGKPGGEADHEHADGPAGPPSLIRPPPPQNMTGARPGGKNASDCPPRTGREWVCMVS